MPSLKCFIHVAAISCVLLIATMTHDEQSAAGMFPSDGEWSCYRRTGTLDAHSPLKGRISTPAIAWKQYIGHIETLLIVEPGTVDRTLRIPLDTLGSGSDEAQS